jgi:endonuclease/exonuclease/phosphatase family metal-dependent hydrolase
MTVRSLNRKSNKRTWAGYLFRSLIFIVAGFTLVAGWCSVFPPSTFWFIALSGLAFPFLWILNLVSTALLLFTGKRSAIVPLSVLLLTAVRLPLVVQPGTSAGDQVMDSSRNQFRVMSYNVRLFDLYNWSHNEATRDRIIDFLHQCEPDILCLQEFFTSENKPLHNLRAIRNKMGQVSIHAEYPINLYGTDHFGIATVSRFRQVNKGTLYFDRKTANICIFTDLVVYGDTIRVYNCHLQSIRFGDKDYKFLKELQSLDENTEQDTYLRTRNIFSRLKNAYVKREGQAELMAAHIRNSPYPVIVCGDFNDTPISFVYTTLTNNLCDAFRESGSGWGTTYAGPIPGLRIDYILHSESLKSSGFKVHPEKLSDHFAISTILTAQNAEK